MSTAPLQIVINGRFLTRSTTGVERVARNMTAALSDVLSEGREISRLRVLLPRSSHYGGDVVEIGSNSTMGVLPGQVWEQFELPLRVKADEWLYNPCNLGPIVRRKSIVTIHDAQVYLTPWSYSAPFRLWYRGALPILGHRAEIVTTVSEYSKQMLEKYGVVPPGKAHVIPNGGDHIHAITSDTTVLIRKNLARHGYVLAIGSLSPHKNLRMVLEAAEQRRDGAIPIVVAGGSHLAFARSGLPVRSGVHYLGRVSDAELKALYENALCLVFPSLYEGFGLPPLEAMGCGCPVIASPRASISEVCGNAVLYADPEDPQAWAEQIDRIACDSDLRATLSSAGCSRATQFTWQAAAVKLLNIVDMLHRRQE